MTHPGTLSVLMHTREVMESSIKALEQTADSLTPPEYFLAGMTCSDIVAASKDLLMEFEVLFENEMEICGDPPEPPKRTADMDDMIYRVTNYCRDILEYLNQLGKVIPDNPETTITDDQIWDFTG